jgi:hypothetical protein
MLRTSKHFLCATLLLPLLAPAARADLIVTEIGGGESFVYSLGSGPSGPIGAGVGIGDDDSGIFSINGVVIQTGYRPPDGGGVGLSTATFSPLRVTAFDTETDGTRYTFTTNASTDLEFLNTYGGGLVSFKFTSLSGFVSNADPSVLHFSGTVELVSSTNTLYDFSVFTLGGQFQMDLDVSFQHKGVNLNTVLSTPHMNISGHTGGDWTMTAVPAPPALVLVLSGGVCLLTWGWVRRRRARTA